jgi:Dyp-type peroxidase family
LGFDLARLPEEDRLPDTTESFLDGMSGSPSVEKLKDPDPKTWEDRYQDGRIDAMILLADNNEGFLEHEAGKLMTKLREFSAILAYERGNVLRKGGHSVEHFGYADGISQLIFLETDTDLLKDPKDRQPGYPLAPLELVLVEDRLAKREDCFGSYLVFRKLEQDVIGFEHGKRNLAEQLGLKESDSQQVGAMMVGRFEEGTPLALSDKALVSRTGSGPPENNFTYDDDREGRCPAFAHIRATNPRDGTEQRIVRRGMPYGRRASWDRLPIEAVGLLFMCFQANIDKQFVAIQQRANEAHDPIIGEARDLPDPPDRELLVDLAQGAMLAQKKPSFDANWVKLRGGEFFFAPSIPFLTGLNTKS